MKKGWRLLPPKHSRRDGGANQKDRSECRDIPGVGHPSLAAPDASQQRHGIGEREKLRGDLESWRQRGDWRMAVTRHRATWRWSRRRRRTPRRWRSAGSRADARTRHTRRRCTLAPSTSSSDGARARSANRKRVRRVSRGEGMTVAAIRPFTLRQVLQRLRDALGDHDRSQQVPSRDAKLSAGH